MTVSADVRLIPSPPARVETIKTFISKSALNSSIRSNRDSTGVEPSRRKNAIP